MKTSQHIHCSVESCKHNEDRTECRLESIMVSPPSHNREGHNDPEAESQCSSFDPKITD